MDRTAQGSMASKWEVSLSLVGRAGVARTRVLDEGQGSTSETVRLGLAPRPGSGYAFGARSTREEPGIGETDLASLGGRAGGAGVEPPPVRSGCPLSAAGRPRTARAARRGGRAEAPRSGALDLIEVNPAAARSGRQAAGEEEIGATVRSACARACMSSMVTSAPAARSPASRSGRLT